ncbi:hypothetical protein [Pseudonocardia sp. D17]|uniref:hypothetical protein n=1 Tax=Pseudonocardia sp. D17 TaxID=882661 RepID=UPI0030CC0DD6
MQYRRWMLRRIAGWAVAAIGVVMIVVHVAIHLANVQVMSGQDLLIGYPMGAVLIIVGVVVVSRR